MPKLKCIENRGYMKPIKIKSEEQEKWKDLDGIEHDKYKDYKCDCGKIHRLDIERHLWLR